MFSGVYTYVDALADHTEHMTGKLPINAVVNNRE